MPGEGETWYQSFTATQSGKLKKFAFAGNGSLDGSSVYVKIREGEGIDGKTNPIIYNGNWANMKTDTTWTEYEITSVVQLTKNQKYSIQLTGTDNNINGGTLLGNDNKSPHKYDGGQFYYSGYGGVYGDLMMKIWVER